MFTGWRSKNPIAGTAQSRRSCPYVRQGSAAGVENRSKAMAHGSGLAHLARRPPAISRWPRLELCKVFETCIAQAIQSVQQLTEFTTLATADPLPSVHQPGQRVPPLSKMCPPKELLALDQGEIFQPIQLKSRDHIRLQASPSIHRW